MKIVSRLNLVHHTISPSHFPQVGLDVTKYVSSGHPSTEDPGTATGLFRLLVVGVTFGPASSSLEAPSKCSLLGPEQ